MSRTPGWPVVLRDGDLTLRPYRMRDAAAWSESRMANEDWVTPWEPVAPAPYAECNSPTWFPAVVRTARRQARDGSRLAFSIWWGDRYAGQLNVSIIRGAMNGGSLGYWVDRRYAGQGICPTAVAMVTDHCFGPVGLHRMEANVRPENHASRRVVEKLGFREEGRHLRYLRIDGEYRDHICYALTTEDVAPDGLLHRWRTAAR